MLIAEMSIIICLSIQCFILAMMLIAEMPIIICLFILCFILAMMLDAEMSIIICLSILCFIMPPPFIMGGHIASPLSVRPVPYVRKMVSGRYLLKTLVYWIHISYTGI